MERGSETVVDGFYRVDDRVAIAEAAARLDGFRRTGENMNLRIARKIRRKWQLLFGLEQKLSQHRFDLRGVSVGGRVFPAPTLALTVAERREFRRTPSQYHDNTQILRAFRRLSSPERLDWRVDMAILRAMRELQDQKPWEVALGSSAVLGLLMGEVAVSVETAVSVEEGA